MKSDESAPFEPEAKSGVPAVRAECVAQRGLLDAGPVRPP